MLLRTRISLFVILAFVVICGVLAVAALQREDLVRSQYSESMIADRATLWTKIAENLVQTMSDQAAIAQDDFALRDALARRDQDAVQRAGARIAQEMRREGFADRLDILFRDGSLAYSSQSAIFQSAIIAGGPAREAMGLSASVGGIGNDRSRNVAAVLGASIRESERVVGLAAFGANIRRAIREMESATGSSVVMVNRRGRLLAGDAGELWGTLQPNVNLSDVNTLQTVDAGDRVYSAIVLPQTADLGSLVSRIVFVRDTTALARDQERIAQITIGAVAIFAIAILIGLSLYLARAFAPLTEGVEVLNALSRGDLQVQIEQADGRDEVGRIAGAVNVFRSNLIAFDRFRRSRERQRRRQERFIRKEMTDLAATLDDAERAAVLEDLGQLEHAASHPADEAEGGMAALAEAGDDAVTTAQRGSDGLAMMAMAFQKMSDRVQDQNQRLREALAAKNAFVALQKELDIASRVQLSLMPDPLPPTERFEISGAMTPAKEVGGDFYDFFRIDDDRIGVVVADVSGKGVPAALFTVMARTLLQATARHVASPGAVLANVNEILIENNAEELFVTVFYGVLEMSSGRFTYANGGHNPPILQDEDGLRPLPLTDGMMLAMFDGVPYNEHTIELRPGARLVLFTDGVVEACNEADEEYGDDRLLALISGLPEQSSEDDVSAIVASAEAFAGTAPQFDDITCVVLRMAR